MASNAKKTKDKPLFSWFGGGDTSAGISQHKGVDCVNSSSQSIAPFLLPLLELVDRAISYVAPVGIPSTPDIIEAYLKDTLTEQQASCLMRINGDSWPVWLPVLRSRRRILSEREWIEYGRRKELPEQRIADGLRRNGAIGPGTRTALMELYDRLPSVSEVLLFLQRNVFDTDYVRDYNLMEGFQERFWTRYGLALRAQGVTQQVAEDHYAAHWILPPVGQLAEMLQRLRPGRVDPTIQFDARDFNRLLAEQDIAPYFRERLRSIAYRVLPLRQLNQAAQQGRFNRAELIERWKDIGFNDTDAPLMADTLLVLAARQRASLGKGYTPAVVSKLAAANLIDKQAANAALNPQGFSAADVDTLFEVAGLLEQARIQEKYDAASITNYAKLAAKAYGTGAVDRANAYGALRNAGYTDNAAQLVLSTVDLQERYKAVNVAVKSVHRARIYGEVDNASALAALQTVGIPAQRAQDYVNQWALELTVPRISASTSRIMAWMRKGLLSIANGQTRLANLGWAPDDVNLMTLEVQQEVMLAKQKANAANARALAKAQRDAQRALKTTQMAFCKLYTPSKLKGWYARRIIDEATLRQRLDQCGYSATAADDLAKEAEVARAANDAKAARNGAAGIEYTGPGADTS